MTIFHTPPQGIKSLHGGAGTENAGPIGQAPTLPLRTEPLLPPPRYCEEGGNHTQHNPSATIRYSIVIPVYNTSHSLIELVNRIDQIFSSVLHETHEIIFVDDASPNPQTWPTLTSLAQKHTQVQAVQLMRNFGQQPATLCGLNIARGERIITMDDDLQHLPEEIPKLISECDHDIVVLEFPSKSHNIFKRIASLVKGWFDHVLIGKPRHIQLSAFRLLQRNVVNAMLSIRTPYPFIPAMMLYISKDIVAVAATHGARRDGTSGYTPRRMIQLFNNLLFNNSAFLLRTIAYIGVGIASFSIMFALYLAFMQLFHHTSPTGWTSLIVSILFIGGMNLFTVGILGEYLLRIIAGVESKPTYVIRHRMVTLHGDLPGLDHNSGHPESQLP